MLFCSCIVLVCFMFWFYAFIYLFYFFIFARRYHFTQVFCMVRCTDCIVIGYGSLGVRILGRIGWIFSICGSCMCNVCLRSLFRYVAQLVYESTRMYGGWVALSKFVLSLQARDKAYRRKHKLSYQGDISGVSPILITPKCSPVVISFRRIRVIQPLRSNPKGVPYIPGVWSISVVSRLRCSFVGIFGVASQKFPKTGKFA